MALLWDPPHEMMLWVRCRRVSAIDDDDPVPHLSMFEIEKHMLAGPRLCYFANTAIIVKRDEHFVYACVDVGIIRSSSIPFQRPGDTIFVCSLWVYTQMKQ